VINAPYDKEFVFHDGTRVKNLLELVTVLERLSDSDYSTFVNSQKNDFSDWIEYVLIDKTFAEKIRLLTVRNTAVSVMKDRINELAVEESILKMTKREVESQVTREATKKVLISELANTEKKAEHAKEARVKRGWFHVFAKRRSEKRLKKIERAEEEKYASEKNLGQEIAADYKENALWVALYVILIILIVVLLAYKLLN